MMQTTSQNVLLVPGNDPSKYPNYSKTSSTVLGILHAIICDVLCIVGIVGVAVTSQYVATMWSTLFLCVLYISASVCAIIAGRTTGKGVVIASMVLNVLVAIVAVIFVIHLINAIVDLHVLLGRHDYNDYTDIFGYDSTDHNDLKTTLIVCYILLFIYFAQSVITIWTSALGCGVSCCGQPNGGGQSFGTTMNTAPVVVPMHGQHMSPGAYIVQSSYPQVHGAFPQQPTPVKE